jgi:large subunit ribosomal protein L18
MKYERTIARQRLRRRFRVRKRMRGTAARPRMTVSRSLKHMYVQVIDDTAGRTLVAASTLDKDLREPKHYGGNRTAAEAIGKAIAERAIAAGIKQVAFDRGSCQYHGRVEALASAARKAGLDF